MFGKQLFLVIGLLAASVSVSAFQEIPGDACTGSGPCTYQYQNSQNQTITVTGNCAPDQFCADNGAVCVDDTNCYNSCGAGTCGGVGATCNADTPFTHGNFDTQCDTDRASQCDVPNQVCVAAVQPSRRAVKERRDAGSDYQFKYFKPRKAEAAPAPEPTPAPVAVVVEAREAAPEPIAAPAEVIVEAREAAPEAFPEIQILA